jgi:hypothetical protein
MILTVSGCNNRVLEMERNVDFGNLKKFVLLKTEW